jgi:hypothetical protein
MKTVYTDVFKAGLVMIIGLTAAAWILLMLSSLLALVA